MPICLGLLVTYCHLIDSDRSGWPHKGLRISDDRGGLEMIKKDASRQTLVPRKRNELVMTLMALRRREYTVATDNQLTYSQDVVGALFCLFSISKRNTFYSIFKVYYLSRLAS